MLRCLTFLAAFSLVGVAAAAEPLKVSQRWALLVGVDDYAYAQKLQFCGADQQALRNQLVAAGFPEDHVFLLHDKGADARLRPSKANIERHLDLVLNLADAQDLVIIGFSGHGVHLNGKSFLCPGDCSLDQPNTLVAIDDVYDRLTKCAANFKLVVVDACRNDPRPGGARDMRSTDGTRALARSLQEIKLPEGVVLLNSCAPGEVSWEDEKFGHGVFMHFLLDGLKGAADTGGDGQVSLNELQSYAGTKTKAYVANQYRVPQRPFFRGDLTTEALEYALLPIPGGVKAPAGYDRFDKTKPATSGLWIKDAELKPVVWGVLRGGPADTAGLQVDDLIVSIGDRKVVNGGDIFTANDAHRPGDAVDFVVERGGRQQTIRVVPEARSDELNQARMKAMADEGVPWAMVRIGLSHLNGSQGLPKDEPEGVRWIRRAADTGDAVGLHELARLYYFGTGVARDYAEARSLLERAHAATGPLAHEGAYGSSASLLGDIYTFGYGVPKDPARASKYYREATDLGNPRAAHALGVQYETGSGVAQDYAKALQYYRQSADYHYGAGEYNVGRMFHLGHGVQSDFQTARSWMERAVEHGHIDAHTGLGYMCEQGLGGPRDVVRAAELYRLAAEQEEVTAMTRLGSFYRTGTGVPRDYAKALELFQAAADKGDAQGELLIGHLYYFGEGRAVDYATALRYYESASQKGVVEATYNLGTFYRNGTGVTQNYAKAMEYFQAAAAKKYPAAETSVGAMIYNGFGVQKDFAVARGWYEAAVAHGDVQAMYNLGFMYEHGEGGPKDLVKAIDLYRKAADGGHADAQRRLNELR